MSVAPKAPTVDECLGCNGQDKPYRSFLILHDLFSRHNVGNVIRSASAMGVSAVLIVGLKKFRLFGAHRSDKFIPILTFDTLEEAREYCHARECQIVGIEILDEAQSLLAPDAFRGNTAFFPGNEGLGMSERARSICDRFVYLPQYGGGTASMNVTVATSISLHYFAAWSGMAERERQGEKFVLDELVPKTEGSPEEIAAADARRAATAAAMAAALDEGVSLELFDE